MELTMSKTTVAIRVEKDIHERFKILGQKRDRSPHYLMKAAVERYLQEEEREQAEYELLESRWANYERTGVAIAGDDVKTWIESLPE